MQWNGQHITQIKVKPITVCQQKKRVFSLIIFSSCVFFLSREPVYGYTPLMEAAASGHEIIVQYLLNHVSVQTGH